MSATYDSLSIIATAGALNLTSGPAATTWSVGAAAADTAGYNLNIIAGAAGPVSTVAGKNAGILYLKGATGVAATASLAAGRGSDVWVVAGSAGSNSLGGGGANGGAIYLQPGALTGSGSNGTCSFLDTSSTAQLVINPNGATLIYPATASPSDGSKSCGGVSNRWSTVYTFAVNSGAANLTLDSQNTILVGPTSTTSIKIGHGSGSSITFNGPIGFYNGASVSQQSSAADTSYTDSGSTVVHTAGTFTGGSGSTARTPSRAGASSRL